jgi:hypothetical protein
MLYFPGKRKEKKRKSNVCIEDRGHKFENLGAEKKMLLHILMHFNYIILKMLLHILVSINNDFN